MRPGELRNLLLMDQQAANPRPYGKKATRSRKMLWDGLQHFEGLEVLRRIKSTLNQRGAANRNAVEESPAAVSCERRCGTGAAYEAGFSTGRLPHYDPRPHIETAIRLGLPRDTEAAARAYLES